MEEVIRQFVTTTALIVELVAALIIAFGGLLAIGMLLNGFVRKSAAPISVRLALGRWLALSLEFLLAADILQTAVAPTWNEIGQLGAIAFIRTALNFFLEREIKSGAEEREAARATDKVGEESRDGRRPSSAHQPV